MPVMVSALTVTAAVPVEERVTDWVAGELRATPPKAMVVTLTLSVGPDVDASARPSCRAKLFVTPFELAVNIAVCAVVTVVVEAVKLAVLAPAATVTEAGTVTAEMLLARLTSGPAARRGCAQRDRAGICSRSGHRSAGATQRGRICGACRAGCRPYASIPDQFAPAAAR